MAAPPVDPAPTAQTHEEDEHHKDEQEATRAVAVRMRPNARPRANAPAHQEDDQPNQKECHPFTLLCGVGSSHRSRGLAWSHGAARLITSKDSGLPYEDMTAL
jgi:hypothetical protein